MRPEELRLLYPHITLIFHGIIPKVEVKGTFEGPLGIIEVKNFKTLYMPGFMIWRHQISLLSGISSVVYKIPTIFSEVLITPNIEEDSKINTGPLEMELAV